MNKKEMEQLRGELDAGMIAAQLAPPGPLRDDAMNRLYFVQLRIAMLTAELLAELIDRTRGTG